MREIKFRGWNSIDKSMYELPPYEELLSNDNYAYGYGSVELMLWTGLTDKNGKGIYEGDIIKIPAGYSGDYRQKELILEVKYDLDDASYYQPFPDGISYKDCEIIGNIYENSELLEETQ